MVSEKQWKHPLFAILCTESSSCKMVLIEFVNSIQRETVGNVGRIKSEALATQLKVGFLFQNVL
jgi:hypothetical protein